MRELQDPAATEAGGLLRVLLIRVGEVPADAVPWLLWIESRKETAHAVYVGVAHSLVSFAFQACFLLRV
jgi:hypothetical protein